MKSQLEKGFARTQRASPEPLALRNYAQILLESLGCSFGELGPMVVVA
jgi:hypothetical protein